jgi:caa(3)-type oxidase subunit IV
MDTIQTKIETHRPNYIGVFAVLSVLTGLEILVTYLPLPKLIILIPLAVIKATLVALFYMHLKIDRRVFSALFGMGLVMGIGLIISFMVLFGPQLLDIKQKIP